jgi:hypothetical protein
MHIARCSIFCHRAGWANVRKWQAGRGFLTRTLVAALEGKRRRVVASER